MGNQNGTPDIICSIFEKFFFANCEMNWFLKHHFVDLYVRNILILDRLLQERDEAAESKKVVKRPVNAVNEKADAKHEETSTRTLKKGKITPSKPHETITSTTSKVPFNEVTAFLLTRQL